MLRTDVQYVDGKGQFTQAGVRAVASDISAVASSLAGRNRIINGQGRINQRGYVSGTATTGANQYTLDRWRVVTSGQNLLFTGSNAARTMTAPAGGAEQVIEAANIEGGNYVINWTGTATCTVNGVSRAKGASFTLPANTDATVRFTGGTFTDAQLELGTTATPFERLPIGDELARCQRYYETGTIVFSGSVTSGLGYFLRVNFRVVKRSTPTLGGTGTAESGFPTTRTFSGNTHFIQEERAANGTVGNGFFASDWFASAEF